MKNKAVWWISILVVAIVGGLIWLGAYMNSKPGALDEFAQCLGTQGATFYGAFWCPHCQNQKTMFGRSARLLPYVECSTPDGQRQTQECIDKKIDGYPTWELKDGSRLSGEIPLTTLAEKTGCTLPTSY